MEWVRKRNPLGTKTSSSLWQAVLHEWSPFEKGVAEQLSDQWVSGTVLSEEVGLPMSLGAMAHHSSPAAISNQPLVIFNLSVYAFSWLAWAGIQDH